MAHPPASGPVDQFKVLTKYERIDGTLKLWPLKVSLIQGANDGVFPSGSTWDSDQSEWDVIWKKFFAEKWDPLATLPGNATTFSDVTAVRNKVYYYVISSIKGDDVLFTPNQQYGYFPDTGPGPSKLLRGNWNEGYFGTCTQAELFGAAELCTALAFTPSAQNTNTSWVWHKFILDGKILFMPDLSIASTAWYDLYINGLVYGVDGPGETPDGFGIGSRNQKKQVTKNNRTYRVRLPKGSAAPTTEYLTDLTATDGRWSEGEWNRTMGRMGCANFTRCTRSRLGNKPVYTTDNTNLTAAYTQHLRQSNAAVLFWYSGGSDVPTYTSWTTAYFAWRPVLELIL